VIASTVLDSVYKHESDANVRERILLVRRIISDGQDIVMVSKEELHRSRAWAYKWLKRFDKEGLEGLKDRPKSGRPAGVPKEMLSTIRRDLSESPSGWKAKEIMDIIYKRTGVRYNEVHVYRLLHEWGFKPKVPQRRFVNIASKEEKEQFKKRWKK
jgi:putative transposase